MFGDLTMLDIKLETLLVVAECSSFTKATEILSLTQPAVSNHINQLERECNAKLFFPSFTVVWRK